MPRALVTGGAGFIGSHLCEQLLSQDYDVCVVDNLATGIAAQVPEQAEFVEMDVSARDTMERLFDDRDFDIVLHLAAQVSNIISHQDPWLDFRTNVGGTLNVLEQVQRHQVPRLLYASSMAVYGACGDAPVSEDAPTRPLSPYGVSKLAAEQLIHNAARESKATSPLSVTSLRMFNVYGPLQSLDNPYQGVVSVFINNVLEGKPITLFGDGEQTRDFVHIDDVIRCWMAALESRHVDGSRLNVGSGKSSSINELIDAVVAGFGMTTEEYTVLREPELPGDQRAVRADTTKTRDLLGWQAESSLADGLRSTVEWAKASGSATQEDVADAR